MDQPRVTILGVSIHAVDFQATLAQIAAWIRPAESPSTICRQICTVNPEFIMDARRDPQFAAVLQRADLRVPDGIGVLWATRLLGRPLQERVTGSDGIYRICERAAREQWRVYLLGAAPGVAEKTASILQKRYPGLQIVGVYSGSPRAEDWPIIHHHLQLTQPEILFVAFGHPRQDFWIDAHRHELPTKVAIGVGGAFDFVAGVTVRAPRWVQRLGLEWLHRLIHEPWRWRRMLKLPQFVALVIVQRFGLT
ncbi:MAG: WecB/TagA/CpsF family glycosyltransferase [Chloroflexi bacterium]|nr:WecB/TagA/CpsF family glycosyltransferase [Chloroflexota bacterium]